MGVITKERVAGSVTLAIAAQIRGLSRRRLAALCENGFFTTAFKTGSGKTSAWRVARTEVMGVGGEGATP